MSTYQGLSRSLVLISIILIYSTKNRTQLIYFLFSAFILFLLGSRSEFALFIIASFMVNILNKKRIYLKIFSISLSVLLLFLLFNPEVANDLNNTSRIFSLLNPQLVYASEGRGILTYNAINTINENIFFGDIKNVGIGESAHNILSAWEINGVFFIILVFMISFTNLFLRFKRFQIIKD